MGWLITTQILVLLIPPVVAAYLELRYGGSMMTRRAEPIPLHRGREQPRKVA